MNEIEIMRKLSHKNIVKLIETYETDHSYYLVMDCLSGGTLKDRLNDFVDLQTIKSTFKGLVNSLVYLNQIGIVHRDIKPENILFRKNELKDEQKVCLIDFGLATSLFLEEKDVIYERCGTPGYVAPEILDKSSEYFLNPNSDVYSLGLVLHLMLLKFNPFTGKNGNETLKNNKECKISFNSNEYDALNGNGKILFLKNDFS